MKCATSKSASEWVLRNIFAGAIACLIACVGCGQQHEPASQPAAGRAAQLGVPADTTIALNGMRTIEDFEQDLAHFQTVFWDPADTISLRQRIREQPLTGMRVLEIGTGTGLLSLCCLQANADQVIATDINPAAIVNAVYNAELLGLDSKLITRLVSSKDPSAYSVIEPTEKFDLIVSNPPWENGTPQRVADYAFYDEGFALLDSLFAGLRQHLNPSGKVWLAYGCVDAIRSAQRLAIEYGLELTILDDRQLDELDNLFLPGMLLEIKPRVEQPLN